MRLLRPAIVLLTLAVIGWFAYAARDSLAAVDWLDPRVLGALLGLMGVWIAGQILAGGAWWVLIGRIVPLRRAVGILLTTQIGKYLPGNVGQFVGRAYLGHRHGVPLARGGASITAEGLLSIGLGLAVALAMLALDGQARADLAGFLPDTRALMALTAAVLGGLAAVLLYPDRFARLLPADSRLRALFPPPLPLGAVLSAAALHALVVTLPGLGLWLVTPVFTGQSLPAGTAIAVISLAVVAGFVTPGAPGGLGVREAVIAAGAGPYIGTDAAIVLGLTLRAATVLGDAAIFAIGWALLRGDTPPPETPAPAAG